MTRLVACIPTIGLSPYLDDLVFQLEDVGVRTRLYVNGEHIPENVVRLVEGWPIPDGPELVHMPDDTIYTEWNHAAAWAHEQEAHLLCVTDDVVISPGVPGELDLALIARDNYGLISTDTFCSHHDFRPVDVVPTSHPTGNRYHFATWCFIAHPDRWVDVDSCYRIWYGDDDLIWKVNAAGWGVGYLQGVGVTHHTSTTSRQVPWVMEAANQDGIEWMRNHS